MCSHTGSQWIPTILSNTVVLVLVYSTNSSLEFNVSHLRLPMLFSASNCRDPYQHFLFFFHLLLFLRFSYHGNHNWSIKSNHIGKRLACRNGSKCKMLLKTSSASFKNSSRQPHKRESFKWSWRRRWRVQSRWPRYRETVVTPGLQNTRSIKRLSPGKMRPASGRF